MHLKLFFMAALLSLTAVSFTTLSSEKPAGPWELLGSRAVNYALDRDEIMVTRSEGTFTALKVKVRRSAINLHKIVVHYGNGELDEIETRVNIPKGGETRVIDLPGNRRVIKKVVFFYDTKNLANDKAVVELWGKH